jgi:hypothetical protein
MPEPLRYPCPTCGTEVEVGKPCPGCPTRPPRKKRSWEEDGLQDGLDLPDEDFDYDDFVAREFGKAPHRKTGLAWYWWVLALVVLAAMLAGSLL